LDPEHYELRDFLTRIAQPHEWYEAGSPMNLGDAGARVTMVVRGDRLGKTMSAYLVERIRAHPLIDVRFQTQVVEADADGEFLGAVTIADAGPPTTGSAPTPPASSSPAWTSWKTAAARTTGRSRATRSPWR
jgi:hypothetical protein